MTTRAVTPVIFLRLSPVIFAVIIPWKKKLPPDSNRGVEICENSNWQRPKLICTKDLGDLTSGSKIAVFWF